jgi:CHAT domain-containing protein
MVTFAIAWEAGPSAQMELFSPSQEMAGDSYRLKFTPPLRKTIRPPLAELTLGAGELNPLRDRLNRLVGVEDARRAGAVGGVLNHEVLSQTRLVGNMLYDLIIPPDVHSELSTPDLFLEIGVDEGLVEYPWELLFDGTEFLCLKHSVGRFVNVARPTAPTQQRPQAAGHGPLSVLVISVPRPLPRKDGTTYEALPAAEAETQAIVDTLTGLGDAARVKLLRGHDATYDDVYKVLKEEERYHIVHFNGHAHFDENIPHASSMVLHDRDMTTGPAFKFFGRKPPVLFFMNACETAVVTGAPAKPNDTWKNRYDIFGLARAFLDTGAYLIGTRWNVGDKSAAVFAQTFYSTLSESRPLGSIIRDARQECAKAAQKGDISWASYIYYGDPRLCFRKILTEGKQD